MKAQEITKLSDKELKELMYAICRSGRVVIPQYYFAEHIKNFMTTSPTTDDMTNIQFVFESDWTTHEYLDEAVTQIIDNNLL